VWEKKMIGASPSSRSTPIRRTSTTALSLAAGSLAALLAVAGCSERASPAAMTVVAVAVSPASLSLVKGTSEVLKAEAELVDGIRRDVTETATWSSSDEGVVTVADEVGQRGLVFAAGAGTATITAALDAASGSAAVTVRVASLSSLSVSPTSASAPAGTKRQFKAAGHFDDGSQQDLTASARWYSSDITVAAVSDAKGSKGLATAVSKGTVTVRASYSGKNADATLAVTDASLESIAVSPADPQVPLGETEQLTATGIYSDGTTVVLTEKVVWSSSDTSVASLSTTPGSEGLAKAVGFGSSTITAAFKSVSVSTTLSVTAAQLKSIDVTPAGSTVALGDAEQLKATGAYSDGSTVVLAKKVVWSSSDTSVVEVSNKSGSLGQATAVGLGAVQVTATQGSVSGSTTLTVTAAVLKSITVTPADPRIAPGASQQFKATGTYSDSSTKNLTASVTWSSSDTKVATLSSAAGSEGLATAVGEGKGTITATKGSLSGSTTLTVAALDSIVVTPANPTIAKGEKEAFVATGTYVDKTTQDLTTSVTWSSSSTTAATVSNAAGSEGVATGVGVGSATITASLGSVSGSTTLTVTAAVLKSIAVTPTKPTIKLGATEQFTAMGTFSDGTTVDHTTSVTWSSSNTSVATFSTSTGSEGLATSAGSPGTTTVTAQLGSLSGSTTLHVQGSCSNPLSWTCDGYSSNYCEISCGSAWLNCYWNMKFGLVCECVGVSGWLSITCLSYFDFADCAVCYNLLACTPQCMP
jgi:trimeric autotransporter adhesin